MCTVFGFVVLVLQNIMDVICIYVTVSGSERGSDNQVNVVKMDTTVKLEPIDMLTTSEQKDNTQLTDSVPVAKRQRCSDQGMFTRWKRFVTKTREDTVPALL